MLGPNTSTPEVTRIAADGFWIRERGRELFLDFVTFPWFRDGSTAEIRDLEAPYPGHLRWPQLDIDLTIDSIEHPERYPLTAKRVKRSR